MDHREIDQLPTTKNNEILKIINQVTNLDPHDKRLPTKLRKDIQAVIPLGFSGKYCDIVKAASGTVTGALTVYTTPKDRDFYLTGITSAFIKDATNDAATGFFNINIIVSGVTVAFFSFPILALTAQNQSNSLNFPFPIKIDRNSAINTSTNTWTVGNFAKSVTINGFTYQQDVTDIGDGN
jgi:hypothetical protein